MRSSLALAVSLLSFTACAPVDDGADGTRSSSSEILNGQVTIPRSVVSVRVGTAGPFHTAVLLTPNTAITSARWLPAGTAPSSVDVRMPDPSSIAPDTVTTATHLNLNPTLGLAMIRLARPMPTAQTAAGLLVPPVTNAPSVNQTVRCYGYVPGPNGTVATRFAERRVSAVLPTSAELSAPTFDVGSVLEAQELGALCTRLTATNEELVCFVSFIAPNPSSALIVPLMGAWSAPVRDWLNDMVALNAARDAVRGQGLRPMRLAVMPDGATRKCADVANGSLTPTAALNQYTCHGGQNQLFWPVSLSTPTAGFALVSDQSGQCVDVPNGSSANGTGLQQYRCHFGPSQIFRTANWPTGDGQRVTPASAPSSCLTVRAASPVTTDGTRIELQGCVNNTTTNHRQRWGFEAR